MRGGGLLVCATLSVAGAYRTALSRSVFLRRAAAFGTAALTVSSPAPGRAADCLAIVAGARQTIQDTLHSYDESLDPAILRPVSKDLMRQGGSLRTCLTDASRLEVLDERTRDHARDAMEYIASVVEFDAFDKLTKDYEPKAAQMYTKEKLDYSLRAFQAADRELGLFAFGFRRVLSDGGR